MVAEDRKDLIGKNISDTDFLLLDEVIISNEVENIYDCAFEHHNLSSVVIPNTVTRIGDYAFYGCHNLTSVSIPNSVKMIGKDAFAHCEKLSSVYIEDGVNTIGSNAFFYCEQLSSINLPNSITSIGDGAFYECRKLSDINIPNSMTSIGMRAFARCGIKCANIPDGVKSIEDYAFEYCSKLISLKIPKSVHFISDRAFNYCEELRSVEISQENKVFDSRDNCNAIIRTKDDTIVFFCKNTIIPDGVRKIDSQSCSKCAGMKRIRIPQSFNSITMNTFAGCTDIETITVDERHRKFDSRNNCNAIINTKTNTLILGSNKTTIPLGVEVIGKGALACCDKLNSISIPDSVVSIEKYAFSNCKSLVSVEIPGSVEQISENTFNGCENLKSILLGEGVKYIENRAIIRCDSLEIISIPNSVESIGDLFIFPKCKRVKIMVPKGSREKFKDLLPVYKRNIVEQ